MAFSNITALQGYINNYINTNHSRSCTGSELNTALNGIIQFLGTGGAPVTGTYMVTLSVTGGSITTFTIPLSFTPTSTIVQVQNTSAVLTNLVAVTSSKPGTNAITVQVSTSGAYSGTITLSYWAV